MTKNPRTKVWKAEWKVDTGGTLDFTAESQDMAEKIAMDIILIELYDLIELDIRLECDDE